MAKKTYRSIGSIVNTSVLINGVNVPVDFWPVSNYEAGKGGSRFETDDELLQKALESRFDFGMLFYLEKDDKAEYDNVGNVITDYTEAEQEQKVELEVVKVDSIQTAKSYLVDHYNWKPAARVSKSKIQEVAESYGIKFEGLM